VDQGKESIMRLSPSEIAYVALKTWPDVAQATIAVAVNLAESDGETDAMGRSKTGANIGNRDHGGWQISNKYHGDKLAKLPNWRDIWVNAALAKLVWDERVKRPDTDDGWTAWSTYTSGSYLTYMPDAKIAIASPFPPPVTTPVISVEEIVSAVKIALTGTASAAQLSAAQATLDRIGGHFR
jgi:hypothetical protein